MLKSSSLYIAIIITLVIGVICSSLVAVAYFYKSQELKNDRYRRLNINVSSGINILLGGPDSLYQDEKNTDLFGNQGDSVSLHRLPWGIYDIGIVKAFIQKDTLFKIFSIGHSVDSAKWGALYIADQDRPLALGGKTFITGTAYVPKAGVQSAYLENIAYSGYRELIKGHQYASKKTLDTLDAGRIRLLDSCRANRGHLPESNLNDNDSIARSFQSPALYIKLTKNQAALRNLKLTGHIVLLSDSSISIDSTVKFTNILVFAKSVIIGSGFKGACQVFATDSISIGKNCTFLYPSVLGILTNPKGITVQSPIIHIGRNSTVSGQLFTCQKSGDTKTEPLIQIDKFVMINGQVYTQGTLLLGGDNTINGNIYIKNLSYKNLFFAYYSYFYNITLDEAGLSPYYLTSAIFPLSAKRKKVLQWLEAN
ncbi:MAG: hypothetical protein JWR02_3034 [Mucilaginibacter sp.]|nr:hypothetical protein [Mucilaginibacter sp.]